MKKLIFAMLLLFVLVVGFEAQAVAVGEIAPDFKLKNLDGETFMLSDCKCKTVLLVFGATWCPHCRKEIPDLKKAHAEHSDKGLRVVYVDVGESHRKVKSFAKKHQIPYTVLLDEKGEVAQKYGVVGIPFNLVIGPDRKIKYIGYSVPKNLKELIQVMSLLKTK